ncbi:thymidylate synthase [Pseudoalteromonas sp. JC3]|nr:thymidylate synthase [Pseudoalteromonas sp. JC3]WJE10066.1 thymidylate synthase [Pseudoalteromonas sp. JC3]
MKQYLELMRHVRDNGTKKEFCDNENATHARMGGLLH